MARAQAGPDLLRPVILMSHRWIPQAISGGGPVDESCEATVFFEATITDNCCIQTGSVTVEVSQTGGGGTDGMFDRDTNPLAGNSGVNVVCVSGVSIQDLLPASVEAVINPQGGYGFIDIDTGGSNTLQGSTTDTENAATVIKLEYNKVQFVSPSASNSFNGTVNNAIWLRNRDNTQGVGAF